MNDNKGAIERWEGQVEEFKMSASYKELTGIDGDPSEFEWNSFPGFTSLQILQEIHDNLQKRNIEPEEFTDRIIFMSMFRHRLDKKRKWWNLYFEFRKKSRNTRSLARTLDVSGSWRGKEVVWNSSYTPEGK